MTPPDLSVIIPFFNEERHVERLVGEVSSVLRQLGRSFEIVLIDDGSSDRTLETLRAVAADLGRSRVLRHAANAGQAAALMTGLRAARGRILVTLDGDGQNDPADLPAMIDRLDSADLVIGVRVRRQDSRLRRGMSRLANTVRRRVLNDGSRDAGCAIRVFRREVLGSFIPIRTLYSFIPACAAAAGYRVAECEVRHRPREHGRSAYGLGVMWWYPAIDMLALAWLTRRRIETVPFSELQVYPVADTSVIARSRARTNATTLLTASAATNIDTPTRMSAYSHHSATTRDTATTASGT